MSELISYDKADFTYIDKMSGNTRERPELNRMLSELQNGDVVVVKSIDRLSRSTKDLLDIVDCIKSAKANLKILDINIDTGTPMGECVLTILGAIALRSPEAIKRFKMLYKAGLTKSALAREFNVSRVTIYKWIDTLKNRGVIK